MEIKSKYKSPLVLNKMEIIEASFCKKDEKLSGLELGINIEHNLEKIQNNCYEMILSTIVNDENDVLHVYVKGRAIFYASQEIMEMLEKNAIAIMFPYIRSYISLITTQPGMDPIVLPVMNIAAMLDD